MNSIPPQESRDEIVRAVKARSTRLRTATSNTLVAVIGAAALAPVIAAAAGSAPIALAAAGVIGGVGGGQLVTLLQRSADRIRGQRAGTLDTDLPQLIQQTIQTEIATRLDRGDADAGRLLAEVVQFIERVDGFEAALGSAADELHDHLRDEFAALEGRTGGILESLADIEAGQTHLIDRFDEFEKRYSHGSQLPASPTLPAGDLGVEPDDLFPPVQIAHPPPPLETWTPGAEITAGQERYLLYDRQTAERIAPDSSLRLSTALAQRLAPTRDRGARFVWLRQLKRLRPGLMARAAESGLRREHELLAEIGSERGAARAFPKAVQLETDGTTMTSALAWPTQRRGTAPCDGLDGLAPDDGRPLSEWALAELLAGLAGLCDALGMLHQRGLSHRDLTLEGILLAEARRLVLRDLGKTGNAPAHGETQSSYAAPEQRRRSDAPPGPSTDVYQIAALTYHLAAGHPPPGVAAPPLRTQAPDAPGKLADAVDSALSARPADRPTAPALGDAFRAVADELA
ncbi:hypothetical protein GCM10009830_44050 [Glycomyces endophyticus]|uniref:non-specific serine/threonine protein kinase n=1 Tax=Glycomyces endophyticus TaxID=480996 RepID=A0ABN2HPY8_9ACTN